MGRAIVLTVGTSWLNKGELLVCEHVLLVTSIPLVWWSVISYFSSSKLIYTRVFSLLLFAERKLQFQSEASEKKTPILDLEPHSGAFHW